MQFDRDTLRAALANSECPDCHAAGAYFIGPGSGDHFAAVRCSNCRRHLDWLAWPAAPDKRERRRVSRRLDELQRLGADYCEICLRGHSQLPAGDTLDIHHLDGDRDNNNPDNLRVYCSACHRLVEWARIYLARLVAA
jgi:hypothetical protein